MSDHTTQCSECGQCHGIAGMCPRPAPTTGAAETGDLETELRRVFWRAYEAATTGNGSPIKGNDAGFAALTTHVETALAEARRTALGEAAKVADNYDDEGTGCAETIAERIRALAQEAPR